MKNIKRILALVMAIAMTLAVTTSAFATEVLYQEQEVTLEEEIQPRIGYAVHEKDIRCSGGTVYRYFKPRAIAFPYQEWSIKVTGCETEYTQVEAIIYQINGPALTDEISIQGNQYLQNLPLLHNFEVGKEYVIQLKSVQTAWVELWIF